MLVVSLLATKHGMQGIAPECNHASDRPPLLSHLNTTQALRPIVQNGLVLLALLFNTLSVGHPLAAPHKHDLLKHGEFCGRKGFAGKHDPCRVPMSPSHWQTWHLC